MKSKILHTAQQITHQTHEYVEKHPHMSAGVAGGVVLGGAAIWLIVRLTRPKPEEIERRRREYLTRIGRLSDGYLTDARDADGEESVSPTPDVLFYSYELAGVRYNCAQDVSRLADLVRGYRIDQPVQIRYDVRNPGNSIIVSESWNGLRFAGTRRLTDPIAVKVEMEERDPAGGEVLE